MKSITEIVKQTEFSDEDIVRLLAITDPTEAEILRQAAYDRATHTVGNNVYYRGLIGRPPTTTVQSVCNRASVGIPNLSLSSQMF